MADSRVAIVTGGSQGFGAAICIELLNAGYKVCMSDLNEEKSSAFVSELQKNSGIENIKFIVGDVTKESDYKNIFEFAVKEFGSVDILINNAGIIDETNPRKTLDVNVMGPIIGCETALQFMSKANGGKGGVVIVTASISGFVPNYSIPVYIASKHAVVGLIRSYGTPYHFKRSGVKFMALCPSFMRTTLLERFKTHSLQTGLDVTGLPDVLDLEFVTKGLLKLLEEQINGSTLVITKDFGYAYQPLPDVKGLEPIADE